MAEMVSVARFMTREQAEIAHAALESAGIQASVSADDAGGLVPLTNGVDVMVMQPDLERAKAIIDPEDLSTATPEDSDTP